MPLSAVPYLAADTASQGRGGTARQEGYRTAGWVRKLPAPGQALALAARAYDRQLSAALLVACTAQLSTSAHYP